VKLVLGIVPVVALLLVVAVVVTWLTAPVRRGLDGAEERATAWVGPPPLRDLADRAGIRLGSSVMVRDMRRDPQYSPLLAREFNSVTPLVFDDDYRPRPAAVTVREALARATPRVGAPATHDTPQPPPQREKP
jgi:hypothetical protein